MRVMAARKANTFRSACGFKLNEIAHGNDDDLDMP
jgi:hypothetical protein